MIRAMFDGIAPTYDLLNRVLSLGIDQSWRRAAVSALGDVRQKRVLDICAGTLDLALIAQQAGGIVTATDFSREMLQRGKIKAPAIPTLCADAMQLPFLDGEFDFALIGFGLRNLPDPLRGLREARRVVRSRLVVLDFFRPRRTVTRAVQALYNRRLLPLLGGIVSGNRDAYRYLASSIEKFSTRQEVEALAGEAGFSTVRGQDLSAGIAALVVMSC